MRIEMLPGNAMVPQDPENPKSEETGTSQDGGGFAAVIQAVAAAGDAQHGCGITAIREPQEGEEAFRDAAENPAPAPFPWQAENHSLRLEPQTGKGMAVNTRADHAFPAPCLQPGPLPAASVSGPASIAPEHDLIHSAADPAGRGLETEVKADPSLEALAGTPADPDTSLSAAKSPVCPVQPVLVPDDRAAADLSPDPARAKTVDASAQNAIPTSIPWDAFSDAPGRPVVRDAMSASARPYPRANAPVEIASPCVSPSLGTGRTSTTGTAELHEDPNPGPVSSPESILPAPRDIGTSAGSAVIGQQAPRLVSALAESALFSSPTGIARNDAIPAESPLPRLSRTTDPDACDPAEVTASSATIGQRASETAAGTALSAISASNPAEDCIASQFQDESRAAGRDGIARGIQPGARRGQRRDLTEMEPRTLRQPLMPSRMATAVLEIFASARTRESGSYSGFLTSPGLEGKISGKEAPDGRSPENPDPGSASPEPTRNVREDSESARQMLLRFQSVRSPQTETQIYGVSRASEHSGLTSVKSWAGGIPAGTEASMPEFRALSALLTPKPSTAPQEPDFLTQLVERIRMQVQSGESILKIQLKPSSLGRIEIKAETSGSGVVATIIAESTSVKSYLENNLHILQQGFQDQGLKIERIQVAVHDGAWHQQASQGSHDSHPGGWRRGESGDAGRLAESGARPGEDLLLDAQALAVLGPNSTFHTIA